MHEGPSVQVVVGGFIFYLAFYLIFCLLAITVYTSTFSTIATIYSQSS
jgi:hypothetical protein